MDLTLPLGAAALRPLAGSGELQYWRALHRFEKDVLANKNTAVAESMHTYSIAFTCRHICDLSADGSIGVARGCGCGRQGAELPDVNTFHVSSIHFSQRRNSALAMEALALGACASEQSNNRVQ